MDVPVAFIIFNRPDRTRLVFDAIRKARPARLLVIADGPRAGRQGEEELVGQARAIIEEVDWPCEVLCNYSEKNMGCGKRVSSGLDWVFSQVEEAIILEDDCFPSQSFFHYCSELLLRYRDNPKVMHISGSLIQRPPVDVAESYYFTKYPHIWGWASWQRAWQHYDYSMSKWPEFKASAQFRALLPDSVERIYFTSMFDDRHSRGYPDTWDCQWLYTCWHTGGISIAPSQNMVRNIGFGPTATHTKDSTWQADLEVEEIDTIIHPSSLNRNLESESRTFEDQFNGFELRRQRRWYSRLKKQIRGLVRRLINSFR